MFCSSVRTPCVISQQLGIGPGGKSINIGLAKNIAMFNKYHRSKFPFSSDILFARFLVCHRVDKNARNKHTWEPNMHALASGPTIFGNLITNYRMGTTHVPYISHCSCVSHFTSTCLSLNSSLNDNNPNLMANNSKTLM